jgi:hypothetical protein
MSDEAVEAKTGKNWSRWFKHLDAAGAKKMTHQEIVAHLHDQYDVRPWWQQMVAVTYEQACGLRDAMPKVGDTVVLGISPDKPAKQKKFDDKYSLGFPLLADEDHAVAEAFDV